MNLTTGCAPLITKVLKGEIQYENNLNVSISALATSLLLLGESYELPDLVEAICRFANETRESFNDTLSNNTTQFEEDSNYESLQSKANNCSANR